MIDRQKFISIDIGSITIIRLILMQLVIALAFWHPKCLTGTKSDLTSGIARIVSPGLMVSAQGLSLPLCTNT